MTDHHQNLGPNSSAINASPSLDKKVEHCNAPKNSNFSFRLNSPRLLKQSIEALCESEYNPTGLGILLVDAEGFHLATKVDDDTMGYLFLSSTSLDDFQYQSPSPQCLGVNLSDISDSLSNLADEDSVTIYKIGSAKISFMIGLSPSRVFSVDILDHGDLKAKLPRRITFDCSAIFRSADLMQIIEDGCAKESVQVGSVFIDDRRAEIQFLDERSWRDDYQNFLVVGKPGETGKAWLKWGQIKALKKACCLQTAFKVGICSNPKRKVIFQFMLGNSDPKRAEFSRFLIMSSALTFFPLDN